MVEVPHPKLGALRRWDPERIGQFELLGRLGAGAMGQVYLGRSKAGRLVAVKTIKIELAEEPGFRDHFAHEVAAARRVSGMFTAAVVAADAEADVPWLATTYVPAPSLSRLVRSVGPQPLPAIWWLAAGCAEALESIHAAGLVHRDLKPSNVLVAPSGPLVIDFGVARAAERIQLTVTRGAVGTPAYMAPEQARDPRQASAASDIFALGATLLWAATGHPPYTGETVMDVLVRLATEPPDLSGLPAELTDLITGCLARRPADRPTSAALLARLGPLVSATPHVGSPAAGSRHPFLAGPAMALIAEFHTGPGTTGPGLASADDGPDLSDISQASITGDGAVSAGGSSAGDEPSGEGSTEASGETYASQLVPARRASSGRHRRAEGAGDDVHEDWAAADASPAARDGAETTRPDQRWRHGAVMNLPARAAVAFLLVVAGAVLGAALSALGGPPAATTASHGSSQLSQQALGSPGRPPPSAFPAIISGKPAIVLLQPFGDGYTEFSLHGAHWRPGTKMTIRLTIDGLTRTSPVHPLVDLSGSFNYTIGQGSDFFRGPIPAGAYKVTVIGTSVAGARHQAAATFQVIPFPPQGAPPPGPPPAGPPPTGPPPGFSQPTPSSSLPPSGSGTGSGNGNRGGNGKHKGWKTAYLSPS